MKIGLCEKDLRGPLRDNLQWMSEHGIAGFQIWKPKLDAEGLTPSQTLSMAEPFDLEVTAVGGGPNLVDPTCAEQSIELFRSFLDLSVELGPRIVTAETKSKPAELADDAAWESTTATVGTICKYAESIGAMLAIEPAGPCFVRDAEMFLELARRVDSEALKVNYDPANIVWADKDPIEGVRQLADYIVHTHAKDIGRVVDAALDSADERLMDVPAGKGKVGFDRYIAALRQIGYDGWLTIEMHAGDEARLDDIAESARNLRRMV